MVVHSIILVDSISFQLTFQSLVSTSWTGRILTYIYQLHWPFPGFLSTAISFQISSNLVIVFLQQGYNLAALLYVGAMMWGFQRISLHIIFSRSFPVRGIYALHFHHFLADFIILYTLYILKVFFTVFQPFSMLIMFFSYTPDIISKFYTIFKIQDNSVSLFFSPAQIFIHLFLVDLK